MSAARPCPAPPRRRCCSASGFVAVLAALIPLGPGGRLVAAGPALLPGRRLGGPPAGDGAALGGAAARPLRRRDAVAAARARRARRCSSPPRRSAPARRLLHGAPFLLEWLAATVGFAVMLAGDARWRSAWSSPHPPGLGAVAAPTCSPPPLAYPLVVLGLDLVPAPAGAAGRRRSATSRAPAVSRDADAAAADHPPRR